MTARVRPLAEITHLAIEILMRKFGAVDTLRFVNQFTTGFGDYTAEREQLFGGETLDQIIGAVKAKTVSSKKPRGRRPRSSG